MSTYEEQLASAIDQRVRLIERNVDLTKQLEKLQEEHQALLFSYKMLEKEENIKMTQQQMRIAELEGELAMLKNESSKSIKADLEYNVLLYKEVLEIKSLLQTNKTTQDSLIKLTTDYENLEEDYSRLEKDLVKKAVELGREILELKQEFNILLEERNSIQAEFDRQMNLPYDTL